MFDTLRSAGTTYFFVIVKWEYRSKNGVLFENVFFESHVIKRRLAPIAKRPILFVFVYVNITNAIFRLCDLCTHVNFVSFVQHVRDVQCSISKN